MQERKMFLHQQKKKRVPEYIHKIKNKPEIYNFGQPEAKMCY